MTTYAKLTSIGDLTQFGAPVTLEAKDGRHIVVFLEPSQCVYWQARLTAIVESIKEVSIDG